MSSSTRLTSNWGGSGMVDGAVGIDVGGGCGAVRCAVHEAIATAAPKVSATEAKARTFIQV